MTPTPPAPGRAPASRSAAPTTSGGGFAFRGYRLRDEGRVREPLPGEPLGDARHLVGRAEGAQVVAARELVYVPLQVLRADLVVGSPTSPRFSIDQNDSIPFVCVWAMT